MALTRRQFLKRSATIAAGATVAPAMKWLPGTGVSYAAGPSDAIVVFVQLYGGNDGLNTVYPLTGTQRATYEEFRPTLQLPNTVGGLSGWAAEGFDTGNGVLSVGTDGAGNEYALHPAMKAMHDLYLDGDLAVIPGVHYPYADYSHFRSEVIYYTGDPNGAGGFGWMGKYLDLAGFSATEVPAVMLDNNYNPLFTPTGTSLFAFNRLSDLRFPAASRTVQRSDAFSQMYAESALSDSGLFPELVLMGNTGVAAVSKFEEYYRSTCELSGQVEGLLVDSEGCYAPSNSLVYSSPLNVETNPRLQNNGLADDLRHVAAVIRSNVGARFFHVGIGGFDSHSNQEQGYYHSYLLNRVSEAIGGFWGEMKQSGITLPGGYSGYDTGDLSPRVIIVTLSEFGRTSKQNAASAAAAGTDHGRAAPQFVIGSTVQAGMHGTYPMLNDPDLDNDLRMAFDFRDLYGTILERWLNVPAADIGPGLGKLFAATPNPDWLGQSYTSYTPIPFLP
ncbi:MAG: DUF1501 domain-containing protein [Candidatus Binatia bacterium]